MQITNWHHIAAPLLPLDDSEAVAAECEYISDAIREAMSDLREAKTAAGAENSYEAKRAIRSALSRLNELVED